MCAWNTNEKALNDEIDGAAGINKKRRNNNNFEEKV